MEYGFSYQPKHIIGDTNDIRYKSYVRQLIDFVHDNCIHNFETAYQVEKFILSIEHYDTRIINGCVRVQGLHTSGMLISNATFKIK